MKNPLLLALALFAPFFVPRFSFAAQPNLILFLADDLGYGDLASYGHPIIKTPNLDAFAHQGVRLTQCYSASAVCSPSRSALLTGRTPFRNGVYTWIAEGGVAHLRTSEIALPRLLKDAGYATCHSGKWHLNGLFNNLAQPQPGDHGYDWWMATQNNAGPSHENPSNFVRNGQPVGPLQGYSAPLVVGEAITWLKEKRDTSKPFFLAVWTHEPHYPIKSDPKFKALYPNLTDDVQREHHANVTQMDHAFGMLMKSLDEQKLTDSTFVFFTSDNGPEGDGITTPGRGSSGGLRERKRSMHEGGIRVPGLARWPGKIKPGTTSEVPVIGSDVFPTMLAIAGAACLLASTDILLLASTGWVLQRRPPLRASGTHRGRRTCACDQSCQALHSACCSYGRASCNGPRRENKGGGHRLACAASETTHTDSQAHLR